MAIAILALVALVLITSTVSCVSSEINNAKSMKVSGLNAGERQARNEGSDYQ
jgi:hypothetical protein